MRKESKVYKIIQIKAKMMMERLKMKVKIINHKKMISIKLSLMSLNKN